MDFEETLKLVDAAVFAKTDRHLSDPEVTILRGACLGMTYEQMAEGSQYKVNYLMRDIGPRFWKLLSEAFGEEVSKVNLRAALGRQLRSPFLQVPQQVQPPQAPSLSDSAIVPGESPLAKPAEGIAPDRPLVDLSEAPDVSSFCGRTQQLNELRQWIVKEPCRLVVLSGVAGIGKTTLSVKLAQQLKDEFDCVIWRSLQQAPTLNNLLADLIQFFERSAPINLPVDVDKRITQVIESLRSKKCLIVLDAVETILEPGKLAGHYRDGYEKYGEFIKRIAEQQHESCLVIVTREMPETLIPLVGNHFPVRDLKLIGLDAAEARDIFKVQNLSDEEKWSDLIKIYQGNPLELKIVAPAIRELFNGKVSDFLKRKTFVFGGIKALLNDQFERLVDLEKSILYLLAIERRPVSLEYLSDNLLWQISNSDILEALSSLLRRELIDKNASTGQAEFLLHPVLMQYVTEHFTNEVCSEIFSLLRNQKADYKNIKILKNYKVFKNPKLESGAKNTIEPNPIVTSVNHTLTKLYKSNSKGCDQLRKIYTMVLNQSDLEIGYIPDNLQYFLAVMTSDAKTIKQGEPEKLNKLSANSF